MTGGGAGAGWGGCVITGAGVGGGEGSRGGEGVGKTGKSGKSGKSGNLKGPGMGRGSGVMGVGGGRVLISGMTTRFGRGDGTGAGRGVGRGVERAPGRGEGRGAGREPKE